MQMKVMLLNGSSHPDGCTALALRQAAKAVEEAGIETETIFLGNAPMADCIACGHCRKTGQCVFDDIVNEIARKAKDCDGFIFGSPVYYAHPSARLLTVLDRVFYSAGKNFACKPGAAVISARRAGTTASFDVINKYFTINRMPVVSSTYWNNIHGNAAEEAAQDAEGLQTMTNLGKNMAWLIKCIDLARRQGLEPPENPKVATNFIR